MFHFFSTFAPSRTYWNQANICIGLNNTIARAIDNIYNGVYLVTKRESKIYLLNTFSKLSRRKFLGLRQRVTFGIISTKRIRAFTQTSLTTFFWFKHWNRNIYLLHIVLPCVSMNRARTEKIEKDREKTDALMCNKTEGKSVKR